MKIHVVSPIAVYVLVAQQPQCVPADCWLWDKSKERVEGEVLVCKCCPKSEANRNSLYQFLLANPENDICTPLYLSHSACTHSTG